MVIRCIARGSRIYGSRTLYMHKNTKEKRWNALRMLMLEGNEYVGVDGRYAR